MARGDRTKALRLYLWNARMSATFGLALHLVEITVRNAVAEAIERSHGTENWHRSATFLSNLRDPRTGYSPRRDVTGATAEAERQMRQRHERDRTMAGRPARPGGPAGGTSAAPAPVPDVPVGKVIAELKFAFWISMITSSHQTLIWDEQLEVVFPHLPGSGGTDGEVTAARTLLHDETNEVRRFRNRLAHHEPVLRVDLPDMMGRLVRIVGWRSPVTASWLERQQDVGQLSRDRP